LSDKEKLKLKKRAIEGVIQKAKLVLGSLMKPKKTRIVDEVEYVNKGSFGDLNIEETLEEYLFQGASFDFLNKSFLRYSLIEDKEKDIALVMDCSLSMTGEKIALLAVAVAVVALTIESKRLSLMGFDSKIKWIKRFDEDLSPEQIIEKVLELPAGGFTNMELALNETLLMLKKCNKKNVNVILIGDGRYTEGRDPTYLAKNFKNLHVLKLGKDQSGRGLLLDLIKFGNGQMFEARKIQDLPKTMYKAVRMLLR
jgi:Mg-chelatase subunit ChlD